MYHLKQTASPPTFTAPSTFKKHKKFEERHKTTPKQCDMYDLTTEKNAAFII